MADEAVASALSDHATSLASVVRDEGAELPAALTTSLDGAEVVGLGEATHGTRELFAPKRRLLRHLVVERGFRTVALEADVAGTAAVDEHVRYGEGGARAALAAIHVWPWRVEETADLLAWLRTYNEGRPARRRLR